MKAAIFACTPGSQDVCTLEQCQGLALQHGAVVNLWLHTFSVAEKDMLGKDCFCLLLGQVKKILLMSMK